MVQMVFKNIFHAVIHRFHVFGQYVRFDCNMCLVVWFHHVCSFVRNCLTPFWSRSIDSTIGVATPAPTLGVGGR